MSSSQVIIILCVCVCACVYVLVNVLVNVFVRVSDTGISYERLFKGQARHGLFTYCVIIFLKS